MEFDELDDLYGDAILDHCRHPRNHTEIKHPTLSGRAVNPFCGDEVTLQINMENGRVSGVGVQGVGCAINLATTSMLSEVINGQDLSTVEQTANLFRRMMSGGDLSEKELERLGELKTLAAVREYPVRIKCALLAWSAVEETIEKAHR